MFQQKKILITIALLFSLVVSSCNMPGDSPGEPGENSAVLTSVAQTVEADAQGTPEGDDPTVIPTATTGGEEQATEPPPATETEVPPTAEPTETQIPCNAAEFVKDITIPDGKKFDPGATFTKTWRLKNAGSCAWTSGYDLVFSGGDAMGGPGAQQLTADPIEPGETIDVSVDLTAPASAGVYRGNWELRDPSDVTFGIENSSAGVFWVEIEVVEPTATPTKTPMVIITINPTLIFINPTVTLNHDSRGMIEEGESPRTNANNAGDTAANNGLQGFITFDVSSIPDGANILSAKLVPLSTADTIGDPFNDLGPLRVYVDNYGNLNSGDYTPPPVSNSTNRFLSFSELMNSEEEQTMNSIGIAGIEDALGSNKFQIRLQFNNKETNNDSNADVLRATFRLVVTYQNP